MTPNGDPQAMRQQHDALQRELTARNSTVHFAHAGVASVAMVILAGTAARLMWKGNVEQVRAGWLVASLAGGTFAYAAVRMFIGRARLKGELSGFARLKELRHQLGLDDPGSLIPR